MRVGYLNSYNLPGMRERYRHMLENKPHSFMAELMLDPQSIAIARREGVVVISIPARMLTDQTYKPCALDAFEEDARFRPDHSERPYGMTCPARPELQGHPELISPSVRYSEWQPQLTQIDLEWL